MDQNFWSSILILSYTFKVIIIPTYDELIQNFTVLSWHHPPRGRYLHSSLLSSSVFTLWKYFPLFKTTSKNYSIFQHTRISPEMLWEGVQFLGRLRKWHHWSKGKKHCWKWDRDQHYSSSSHQNHQPKKRIIRNEGRNKINKRRINKDKRCCWFPHPPWNWGSKLCSGKGQKYFGALSWENGGTKFEKRKTIWGKVLHS